MNHHTAPVAPSEQWECAQMDAFNAWMRTAGKHIDEYSAMCGWMQSARKNAAAPVAATAQPEAADLLSMLANKGGTIVRTASLNLAEIAAARIERRMYVRDDDCGFVYLPPNAPAPVAATAERCQYCDGTGDVHDMTGKWRGECPECDARTNADLREAWEYSFIHSSALGRGDEEIGPCLSYDRSTAYGVGCIKQRRVLVTTAPAQNAETAQAAEGQREPIAWITKAALKHWIEKGKYEGAHQYTFLPRAGNEDAGEKESPLRVAIYLAAPSSAPAQDKNDRRLTEIGKAIERACRDLPEGFDLHIELERGAGTVSLYLPDTDACMNDFDDHDTFAGQINEAIDRAIEQEKKQ